MKSLGIYLCLKGRTYGRVGGPRARVSGSLQRVGHDCHWADVCGSSSSSSSSSSVGRGGRGGGGCGTERKRDDDENKNRRPILHTYRQYGGRRAYNTDFGTRTK